MLTKCEKASLYGWGLSEILISRRIAHMSIESVQQPSKAGQERLLLPGMRCKSNYDYPLNCDGLTPQ